MCVYVFPEIYQPQNMLNQSISISTHFVQLCMKAGTSFRIVFGLIRLLDVVII